MKRFLKNPTIRVLLIQFGIISTIFLMDLYIFRGFYSSKILISSESNRFNLDFNDEFPLKIIKKTDSTFLFSYTNNSLLPKYFLNYRGYKLFQKNIDSIFFAHAFQKFPPFDNEYTFFDCGTGLGLTSINPLEKLSYEVSYKKMIEQGKYNVKYSDYFNRKLNIDYINLDNIKKDSILKNSTFSRMDSIEVHYYLPIFSYLYKKEKLTISNSIQLGVNDLLKQSKN